MKKILIVEDDENLARGIAFAFEKEGYSVLKATTIQSGQLTLEQHNVDLVLLDLSLPDGNGLELCRRIREKANTPIIMLTACDLETDEVSGFLAGADDYVTKPFSLSVLRARVEAVLRRMEAKENHILHSGDLQLDTALCKLFKGNEEITISATEFRLLNYLMSNAGQVLTKEKILAALWGMQGNYVDENTLSVNISRLRAKIGDEPKNSRVLKTIHGIGYVWVKE